MASKSRQRMESASLLALLSVGPTPERRPPLAAGLRRLLPRKREQASKLPHCSKRWRAFRHEGPARL